MPRTRTTMPTIDVPLWELPENADPKELEARTYRATGPLLPEYCRNLDFSDCVLRVENPVEVFDDTGEKLGAANVFVNEFGELVAELSFDYASPERLLTETSARPLYIFPVGGLYLGKVEFHRLWSGKIPVKEIGVDLLIITPDRPASLMEAMHVA